MKLKLIILVSLLSVFVYGQRRFPEFPEEENPDSTDIVLTHDGTRNERVQIRNFITDGIIRRGHFNTNVIQKNGGLAFDGNNALYINVDGITIDTVNGELVVLSAGSLGSAPYYFVSSDNEDTLIINVTPSYSYFTVEDNLRFFGGNGLGFSMQDKIVSLTYDQNDVEWKFETRNDGILVRDTIYMNTTDNYLFGDGTNLYFYDLVNGLVSLNDILTASASVSGNSNALLYNNGGSIGTSTLYYYPSNNNLINGSSHFYSEIGANILGGASNGNTGMYATILNGTSSYTTGAYSFTHGESNIAAANYSGNMGRSLRCFDYGEHAFGVYNTEYNLGNSSSWDSNNRLFSIGNGTSSARSNALTIYQGGNIHLGDSLNDTTFIGSLYFHNGTSLSDTSITGSIALGEIPVGFGANEIGASGITYGSGTLQMGTVNLAFETTVGEIYSTGGNLLIENGSGEQSLRLSDNSLRYDDTGASGTTIFEATEDTFFINKPISISTGDLVFHDKSIGPLTLSDLYSGGGGNVTSGISQNLSTQTDQGIVYIDADTFATNANFTFIPSSLLSVDVGSGNMFFDGDEIYWTIGSFMQSTSQDSTNIETSGSGEINLNSPNIDFQWPSISIDINDTSLIDYVKKYNEGPIFSFGAGVGNNADTNAFDTDNFYGSFYNSTDTIFVTELIGVLQGSSPTLDVQISWHSTLGSVSATDLNTTAFTITSTTTGDSDTSFDNDKIPPGVWVWCTTPTVTAGSIPTMASITLIGYKKSQ